MNKSEKFERFAGNEIVKQNLKKKSVLAAFYTSTGGCADFLLRLMSTIVLARLLLPEYFGLVAMVTAVTGIAESVRDLGLQTATVQSNDINHEQITNLFWLNVTGGVFFFIFFSSISIAIAEFYNEVRLVPITIALSTNFFWSGLMTQHEALLIRQLKQGKLTLIQLSANFLSVIAAVLLAIGEYNYWALVWREVIRNLFIACGVLICCPWVPGLPRRHSGIRRYILFGRDMSLAQFIIGIILRLDGLLIGRFFGPIPLGLYRLAHNMIMAPIQQINGPILNVAQPGLSRLQSDPERYRRYYKKILFFLSSTTIPIGIFIAVYANDLILLMLGEKWIEAAPFLRLFAIAATIRPSVGTIAIVLITCGKPAKYLIVSLVHSIVIVLLMLFGIWWTGAVGVAIAHLATAVVLALPKLYYSFAQTPINIKIFFQTTKPIIISGIVMMTILICFKNIITINGVFLSIFAGGLIGAVFYFTLLLQFPAGREDVVALYKDLMSSLHRKS